MPLPVTIDLINPLPFNPYAGTGIVGIIITNGVPSFFNVIGSNLNRIVKVMWYPKNPSSVLFQMRNLLLVDNTQGTFMVMVTENYLNSCDRAGNIAFTLDDSTTMTYPVRTYGPLSVDPLWTSSDQGLITG